MQSGPCLHRRRCPSWARASIRRGRPAQLRQPQLSRSQVLPGGRRGQRPIPRLWPAALVLKRLGLSSASPRPRRFIGSMPSGVPALGTENDDQKGFILAFVEASTP
jgi:hypothetical protein